jgi:hypothetical protein
MLIKQQRITGAQQHHWHESCGDLCVAKREQWINKKKKFNKKKTSHTTYQHKRGRKEKKEDVVGHATLVHRCLERSRVTVEE